MRILVTGAAGFVGQHLLAELREHGHEPIGFDRVQATRPANLKWYVGDLLDRELIDAIVAEAQPNACIHLAGLSFVPDGAASPDMMLTVNVSGTLNILDAFKQHRRESRILAISTAHVYGMSDDDEMISESAPLRPTDMYAVSKAASDLAALGYARAWKMPIMTARPANHTGPGQSTRFVVQGLVTQARAIARGDAPPVISVGNIDSERDFCDVRDVVRAYTLLIEDGKPGLAYNIASGDLIPIRKVLDEICLLADIKPEIKVDPGKFRPKDRSALLNTDRINAYVGWRPEISRSQTLHDMLELKRKTI